MREECDGVVETSDIGGEGGEELMECGVLVELVIGVLGSLVTEDVSDSGDWNMPGGGT